MIYAKGTRERAVICGIADEMALTLIRMDRAGIPELGVQPEDMPDLAFDLQSKALVEIAKLLAPADQVGALYKHLTEGSSAHLWVS